MVENGERVFVTGGTGFIGRRLIYALSQRQMPAVALVRRPDHGLPETPWLETRPAELLDVNGMAQAMAGCRWGIHLAAKVSFDPADAAELQRVNVGGTKSFLAAAQRAGLRRVVIVSSAATIGISSSPSALLDEDTAFDNRLLGHNVYLASKKDVEDIALWWPAPEMEVIVANPTTVFGPGDRSLNSGSIVKTVVAGKVVPVPPGGTSVVDVDDVAEGLISALTGGLARKRYILTGQNLTFRQVFETIATVAGRIPRFVYLPRMARIPMKLAAWFVHAGMAATGRPAWLLTPQIIEDTFLYKYFDSRRAQADLGWQAKISFADSVARAWEYYLAEGLIARA